MAFLNRFKQNPKKVFLLNLLKYVLKNNVFKFNDHVFTQLKPDIWVQYIDDVFMVWSHPLTEFHMFLEDLNKRHNRIRFTAEISTQSCNFLDLTIYKSPTFLSTNRLSTKIVYKHASAFSFPLGSSDMPYHIHKSIAIGELTRLLRNTENLSLFRYIP